MISCVLDGDYVTAHQVTDRTAPYACPVCQGALILKKGSRVIHHFAHKPDTDCSHGAGETHWHRAGKRAMGAYFEAQGADVIYYEYPLGRRRCDVVARMRDGSWVGAEVQQKDEGRYIYRRNNDLLDYCERVFWVLPDRAEYRDDRGDTGYRMTATYAVNVARSRGHPLPDATFLLFNSKTMTLSNATFGIWKLWKRATDWGGGYSYVSKRWVAVYYYNPFVADIDQAV